MASCEAKLFHDFVLIRFKISMNVILEIRVTKTLIAPTQMDLMSVRADKVSREMELPAKVFRFSVKPLARRCNEFNIFLCFLRELIFLVL